MSSKRLEGKVALITGGASGIGESTARLFAKHGAKVVIADIQDDLGHSLCKQLLGSRSESDAVANDTITYVHCDVTIDLDVQNAVDLAVSKYGKLDIMLNNAGTFKATGLLATEDEDFKKILDANLFGGFLGAKHAARVMIPAKKGSILFTASMVTVITVGISSPAYVASKHGIVGMAKSLSVELGQHGIRVNCISPFAVATRMGIEALKMKEKKEMEEIVSLSANLKEVVLEAEDIAEAALFLGSDESKYVSGINLVVDGGYSQINPSISMVLQNQSG